MSLSLLEAITILRLIEPNWAHIQILEDARRSEAVSDKVTKLLQQWLDTVATIPASQDVCAISVSLDASTCSFTIDSNSEPLAGSQSPATLIQSVWDWLQLTADAPIIDQDRFNELAEIIFTSADSKSKKMLENKGCFMTSLRDLLRNKSSEQRPTGKKLELLENALFIHMDFRRIYGLTVENTSRGNLILRLYTHVENYDAAMKELGDFSWLCPLEESFKKDENEKPPSLRRYIEKLLKPFRQTFFVANSSKTRHIRAILTKQLCINILPPSSSPVSSAFQSLYDFDVRVKSYLKEALESYSQDEFDSSDSLSSIGNFMTRITAHLEEISRFDSPSAAHCECTLLRHHLDPTTTFPSPFPYVGVSKLSCFQCSLYFRACENLRLESPSGPFRTKGFHAEVIPCALPIGRAITDAKIELEMSIQLKAVIGKLISDDIKKQGKSPLSSFESDPPLTNKVELEDSDDEYM